MNENENEVIELEDPEVVVEEPKKEPENGKQPLKPAKEPEQNQELELEEDTKEPEKKPAKEIVSPKLNLDRYKDLEDDVDSEDKLYDKLKYYKEENAKLKTVAGGRDTIENDPDIKEWKGLVRKNDEELVHMAYVHKYLQGGNMTKEEATAKATEKVAKLKETNPDQLEDDALNVRGGINNAIQEKTGKLFADLEQSKKSVDLRTVESKVLESAKEEIAKLTDFLGLKPHGKTKPELDKKVIERIQSGQFAKDLKNPAMIAKFAMFAEYEKQWTATIAARNNGKAKILDKLPKQPATLKKKGFVSVNQPQTKSANGKKLNVASFLGNNK